MKPLLGFILLTLAIAAGVAALLRRPGASTDLEQHRSDAAGAIAYASLIKGADAKPAPLPTPPPQPIRADAPPNTDVAPPAASESPSPAATLSPPPAAPIAPRAPAPQTIPPRSTYYRRGR